VILSGLEIEKRLDKQIVIDPFDKNCLNPNSYNLKLHNELMVYDEPILDIKKQHKTKLITIPNEGLELFPGTLYLGRTLEYTETNGLVPMLEGRSSIGRLGLFIHITAGFGDVGFKGYRTLEIHCVQPIRIYPYVEICQIYYHLIEGDYVEYNSMGKYQANKGIQPSMLYKEFN